MDQDAFRRLLHGSSSTPKQSTPVAADRPNKKAVSAKPSEPAFKPRKVKKADQKYRDRASERRAGVSNDYAEAEAILEDFEKRASREGKDVIEEQRKYLGGDSQHTILVKGLDVSLLEQNKARAAASTEEDDVLEQAFVEATSQVTEPVTESKKRTREEIVRELKAKRQNSQTDQPPASSSVKTIEEERLALEAAKQSGKFKPIGFKPIGQEKLKKRKVKSDKNGEKKKRRKVDMDSKQTGQEPDAVGEPQAPAADKPPSAEERPKLPQEPEPEPLDEDFDIFAGAGDYQGIPDDDEDSEGNGDVTTHSADLTSKPPEELSRPAQPVRGGWFGDAEHEPTPPPAMRASVPKSPPEEKVEEEEEGGRLKGFESSALPSIRDFLAMQEAADKAEKRRARKEKKKKKKKGGDDDDD